jgi:hypothetical protein
MTKRQVLTMATILTVLGFVVATTTPARPTAMSQPATMEIVPAPWRAIVAYREPPAPRVPKVQSRHPLSQTTAC